MTRAIAMSDTQQQIRDRIEEFVNQLSQLVRQTALESVQDALGQGAGRRRGRGAGRAAGARGGRRKGEKRSSDQIADTTKAVLGYVKKHPGEGVEAIAKGLSTATKELVLPIRKLVGDRQLKTKGQKRATKYFAR